MVKENLFKRFKNHREASLNYFNHNTLIPLIQPYISGYTLNVGCNQHIFGDVRLDIKRTKATNILGDACHLPFKDNCFDTVIALGILHHISNYEQAIKEIIRVCKGYIVGWEPNIFSPHLCLFTYHLGIGDERPLNTKKIECLYNENGAQTVWTKMLCGLKILGDVFGHYDVFFEFDSMIPKKKSERHLFMYLMYQYKIKYVMKIRNNLFIRRMEHGH